MIIAIALTIKDKTLNQNSVNALITAFAIFTALLLNVIFIIYDIMGKIKTTPEESKDEIQENIKEDWQKVLLKHLYSNSLYSLVVCIFILMILILIVIIEVWNIKKCAIGNYCFNLSLIFSFITYTMVAHFLMNLLMITKRLAALLSSKLN